MNESSIQTARRPFSGFESADLPVDRIQKTATLIDFTGDDL